MFESAPFGSPEGSPAATPASAEDVKVLAQSLCALGYAQFALVQNAGLDALRSVQQFIDTADTGSVDPTNFEDAADASAGSTIFGTDQPAAAIPDYEATPTFGASDIDDNFTAMTRTGVALPAVEPRTDPVHLPQGLDLEPDPMPEPEPEEDSLAAARQAYRGTLTDDPATPAGNNTMKLLDEISFLDS